MKVLISIDYFGKHMLNIVLDNSVVLDLLSHSVNDTQQCYVRVQKSPIVRFWLPCCSLSLLETQIFPVHHHPLTSLLKNEKVQLLSSLAAHWQQIPENHPYKIQALISLDASLLPNTTIIWTNHPEFVSAVPDLEFGDYETIYAMLAQYEEQIKLVDLAPQQLKLRSLLEKNLFNVLKHEQYISGPEIQSLEQQLAQYVGSKYCITVASGTESLLIALMAVGVKEGHEVITSSFNSVAAAEMITLLGAKPIFVDIDSRTYNLNALLLRTAITRKTKAIVPTNLYGQCADFDAINMIAAEHNLPVIEDARQSFGARYKDRYSCNLTTIGCTSFSPYNPLGAYGDGGACFTSIDQVAETIRLLRTHGQDQHSRHHLTGLNSRLDTLQASILLSKLSIFRQEIENRVKISATYTRFLKEHDKIKTPIVTPYNSSTYAQYTIEVENRDRVQQKLQERGIPTQAYYPIPIHLQPAFAYLEKGTGSFPATEAAAKRVLSLPIHSYLNEETIHHIAETIKRVVSSQS